MPLFNKGSDIPRSQFKDILKKTNTKTQIGKQLSARQRERMEELDFPKRFGSSISQSEYMRTLHRLKAEKGKEQDFSKKTKIGKEIKFLEELEKQSDLPK